MRLLVKTLINFYCFAICLASVCFSPKYHYEIKEKETKVYPFAVYYNSLAYLTFKTSHYQGTDTATRLIATTNFEKWTDNGNFDSSMDAFPPGSQINYFNRDVNNSTKGIIATFFVDGSYSAFREITGNRTKALGFKEVCNPCGKYDSKSSPSNWVTPARWNEKNLWLSMNTSHFLTSTDLVYWLPLFELGPRIQNSDDKVTVADIFAIAHPTTGEAQWVILGTNSSSYESFYYFFELTESEAKVGSKQQFEYGPDLQEIAVLNSYENTPVEILIVGMISNQYANIPAKNYYPCWTLSVTYARTLRLGFYNGTLMLRSFFYQKPVEDVMIPEIKIMDKQLPMTDGSYILNDYAANSFKMSINMSSDKENTYGIQFLMSNDVHFVSIDYVGGDQTICFERSIYDLTDTTNPNKNNYPKQFCSPRFMKLDDLTVDVFCDRSIVEVFHKSGWFTITAVVYADASANRFMAYSFNSDSYIHELTLKVYNKC